MKKKANILILGLMTIVLASGCIAFPPLIQVEHKDNPNVSNQEVLKRLDAIDRRLDQMETKNTETK